MRVNDGVMCADVVWFSYSIDARVACVTIGCGVPRMLVYVTTFVVSIGVAR